LSAQSIVLSPDAIRFLVVHCSDSPNSEDVSASEIHDMHLGFGWHGIGYHRVIRRDGSLEMGRPEFWAGAHVYGHNHESLGVCLIGCDEFSAAQWQSLEVTVREWHKKYPAARICGHRDFSYTDKTCPNFDVDQWCTQRGISNPILPA